MGICGKCAYNKFEEKKLKSGTTISAYACNNPNSECYGCYTQYDDYCDEYTEKEEE